MADWFVYLVKGRTGQLYCGISTDVERRIDEHNGEGAGNVDRGARWTRAHRPVTLVWQQEAASRSEAAQLEAYIKRLPRVEQLELIAGELELELID